MDVEEKQVQNANGSSLQYLTDQSPGHDRVPGQQKTQLWGAGKSNKANSCISKERHLLL